MLPSQQINNEFAQTSLVFENIPLSVFLRNENQRDCVDLMRTLGYVTKLKGKLIHLHVGVARANIRENKRNSQENNLKPKARCWR